MANYSLGFQVSRQMLVEDEDMRRAAREMAERLNRKMERQARALFSTPATLPCENIICARCNKPVEELHQEYDIATSEILLAVRCHGEIERIRVPESVLVDAKQISFARAFEKNAIVKL